MKNIIHTRAAKSGKFLRQVSRRQFLRNTSTVVAGFAFCSLAASTYAARRNPLLPAPQRSGLDHFVLVTMENRSFDHFLGWLPGADGRQEGLAYTDASGASHPTFPRAPDYQGCSHPDPDHSYLGGRVEYDGGACDGWLRAGSNFAQPNLSAPAFTVPAGSFGSLCFPNARINNGAALLDFAASFGFPLPQ